MANESLSDLLSRLLGAGFKVSREGEEVVVLPPDGLDDIPQDVEDALADNLDEVLALLPDSTPPRSYPPFTHWNGEDLGWLVAVDTETTLAGGLGDPPPDLVVVTAFNGTAGVYFGPEQLEAFLRKHVASVLVFHGVDFDLPVIAKALAAAGSGFDVESFVDRDQVRDTRLMELLLELATTGRAQEELKGKTTLAALTEKHLGEILNKDNAVRLTFDQYLGQPVTDIADVHLDYAAADAVATYRVWLRQGYEIERVKGLTRAAYGYASPEQLEAAWTKYGVLSLNIQIKTALAFRAMSRSGLYADGSRQSEIVTELDRIQTEATAVLEAAGIPIGPGKGKAIQSHLEAKEAELLADGRLTKKLKRTAKGAFCLDVEARISLAEVLDDPVVVAFAKREQAVKFRKTYCSKLAGGPLHPRWKFLTRSGRASCDGDIAAQTLPRDTSGNTGEFSVRQCIVPPPGYVFVGADYSTLEVRGFAYVLEQQLGFGPSLANVIRSGVDVHTAVASAMKGGGPVTSAERKKVKAIVFGLPGTLSPDGIKRSAKLQYGAVLSDEEVANIISFYKQLCPEVDQHLKPDGNLGGKIAAVFGLPDANCGWNLYKVVSGKSSFNSTKSEPYWKVVGKVLDLAGLGPLKRKRVAAEIEARTPSKSLAGLVKMVSDQGSCLSATGRLRAKTSFGASRNGVFQSVCADGALLALWALYRRGYRLAAFIHDELVVCVPEGEDYAKHVETVSAVMRDTMSQVLGGLPIDVEPFVRRSLSSKPEDQVSTEKAEPTAVTAGSASTTEEPQFIAEITQPEEDLPPDDFFVGPTFEAAPTLPLVVEENGQVVEMTFGRGRQPKKDKPPKTKSRRPAKKTPAEDVWF